MMKEDSLVPVQLTFFMKAEEKKKKVSLRTENWLHAGIVVKVITKRLGEKYFKKKGVIKEVIDK